MGFFFRKKRPAPSFLPGESSGRPAEAGRDDAGALDRADFFLTFTRSLLVLIKELTPMVDEMDATAFHASIETLLKQLTPEKNSGQLSDLVAEHKSVIASHLDRQREYVKEREKDFREIIEILTRAMAENRKFNENIRERSNSMEDITRLDDIREMKSALVTQVDEIREAVKEKEADDQHRIVRLEEQVDSLKQQLTQAKKGAIRDGLTGLFNRRAADEYLGQMMANSGSETAFSLCLVRIDSHEQINAAYGEHFGERVVLAIAQECAAFAPAGSFVARYEGHTFLLGFPNTGLKPALKTVRALCASIAATRYSVGDFSDGHGIGFTVSMGVSTRKPQDTPDLLIERAVRALDAAQKAGGNRAVSEKTRYLLSIKNKINILDRI